MTTYTIYQVSEDGAYPAEWDYGEEDEFVATTYPTREQAERRLEEFRQAQNERELQMIKRTAPDLSPFDDCPPVRYYIMEDSHG